MNIVANTVNTFDLQLITSLGGNGTIINSFSSNNMWLTKLMFKRHFALTFQFGNSKCIELNNWFNLEVLH